MNFLSFFPWLASLDMLSLSLICVFLIGSYAIYPDVPFEEYASPLMLFYEDRHFFLRLKSCFRILLPLLPIAHLMTSVGIFNFLFLVGGWCICALLGDPLETIMLVFLIPFAPFATQFSAYFLIDCLAIRFYSLLWADKNWAPGLKRAPIEDLIWKLFFILTAFSILMLCIPFASFFASGLWGFFMYTPMVMLFSSILFSIYLSRLGIHPDIRWKMYGFVLYWGFVQLCQHIWVGSMLSFASVWLSPVLFVIVADVIFYASLGIDACIVLALINDLYDYHGWALENSHAPVQPKTYPDHALSILEFKKHIKFQQAARSAPSPHPSSPGP